MKQRTSWSTIAKRKRKKQSSPEKTREFVFFLFLILFVGVIVSVATLVCVITDSGGEDDDDNDEHRDDDNVSVGRTNDSDRVPPVGIGSARSLEVSRQAVLAEHFAQTPSDNDQRSNACLDTYDYACGSTSEDFFAVAREQNNLRLATVLDGVRVYDLCVSREQAGDSPFVQYLVKSIKPRSYDELAYVWGRLQNYGVVVPLRLDVVVDPFDATRLLPKLSASGIFASGQVVSGDDVHGFQTHLRELEDACRLSKDLVDKEWIDAVVSIERMLYSFVYTSNDDGGDDDDDNDIISFLSSVNASSILLPWQRFVEIRRLNYTNFVRGCGLGGDSKMPAFWCSSLCLRYMESLSSAMSRYTLETWISYTRLSVLLTAQRQLLTRVDFSRWSSIRDVGDASVASSFDCGALAEMYMPVEVNNVYASKYVNKKTLAEVRRMAGVIKKTFDDELADENFKEKLRMLDIIISDGSNEVAFVDDDDDVNSDFYGLLFVLRQRNVEARMQCLNDGCAHSLLRYAVRSDFTAYYVQQQNAVVLGSALLVEPFFSMRATRASNYARLGSVLAHEIAHAIDFIGARFDGHGSFVAELASPRQKIRACLEREYTSTTLLGNVHNGAATLNENFADVLGVEIAYKAFLSEGDVGVEERRDFFLSYAQQFCRSAATSRRSEYEQLRLAKHAMPELRVNNVVSSLADGTEKIHIWNCPDDVELARESCVRDLFLF